MELVQTVLLGILQGIFEWLPVSSEGVISLTMTQLFGREALRSIHVAAWLHLGTMFSALLYFREDFVDIVENLPGYLSDFRSAEFFGEGRSLISFLVLSTFVTALVGGTIYLLGLKTISESPKIFTGMMGLALLVTGLLRFYRSKAVKTLTDMGLNDSVFTGILQGFSVIPGISRSGSTIFGLFYRKYKSREAFRLSFLLSVPAVLLANIGLQIFSGFEVTMNLVLAALTAFLVGYGTIDLILKLAEKVEVAYLCFLLAGMTFISLFLI